MWVHRLETKIFIQRPKTSTPTYTSVADRFNAKVPIDVLLLGYAGGNHDGPYLTDSMMLVHVDPKTKKIFLISIPRDIWVKIPTSGTGGSYWKINASYELGLDDATYPNKQAQFKGQDGGGRLAEYMVSQITGIPVEYFVGADFSGFTKTIDALGGVDVNVETTFDDFAYPNEANATQTCGHSADDIKAFTATVSAETQIWAYFPCRYEHLHFDAGITHMDGATALTYVRSRHSSQDGTDFGRAKRQRNLLVAVKNKIFSIGFITRAIPFMQSLGSDATTDLSVSDLQTFLSNASTLNTYEITTLALTDKNFLNDSLSSDNQNILIPKAGMDNWTNVHNWLSDEFSGKQVPIPAIVQVENGTHTEGLALTANEMLQKNNIQTLTPQNATSRNINTTQIIVYDKNVSTTDLNVVQKEFNVPSVTYEASTGADYNVLVIVGTDFSPKENITPTGSNP